MSFNNSDSRSGYEKKMNDKEYFLLNSGNTSFSVLHETVFCLAAVLICDLDWITQSGDYFSTIEMSEREFILWKSFKSFMTGCFISIKS